MSNTRGGIFIRPAGNRKFELSSCSEQIRNSWIVNRQENDQFCKLISLYKKQFPECNMFQTMLAERAIKDHILIQRIEDRRCFFSGASTGAMKSDSYYLELPKENEEQWNREFLRLYGELCRSLRETLKILMAQNISLNLNAGDIAEVFNLDNREKELLSTYKELAIAKQDDIKSETA